MYKIEYLNDEQSLSENHKLFKEFEKRTQSWYPLGNDSFQLDHGKNYYSFFKRMGKPHFIVVKVQGKIIASCCFIDREGVWYICDLKVDKAYRGMNLPTKIFWKAIIIRGLGVIDDKFYGISMYPTSEKLLRIIKNSSLGFMTNVKGYLLIYSLNNSKMKKIQHLFGKTTSFIDINDKKSLILYSTGNHLPILHLQYNNSGQFKTPQKGYQHMFCIHESSVLARILPCKPISKALIISRNMKNYDWNTVSTSEI